MGYSLLTFKCVCRTMEAEIKHYIVKRTIIIASVCSNLNVYYKT